ncbi:MAG TPA: hypothetical protein VFK46_02840 [Candidatus Macondimonas sp.]|nr:hypothetical protein [Candidatus Macondimonas sp.]
MVVINTAGRSGGATASSLPQAAKNSKANRDHLFLMRIAIFNIPG